ncbi:thioredoxin domain-containing protein [Terrarubrum flagellatum]|uniref:thioredoxin domain-containing protein n=1 Tax=Terrirubrum flagellatum TaxID=2895980 RepID=UPI0031455BAF
MNRLAAASSPYLIQHRDNPVHWWEWSDGAFAEARKLNRPVILSIGYAACHWCHVMAHESFEDQAVADVMNALFVSIKVDREERPDVDHLYMSALHALGEHGGWPLTMFLTPDREPFWGGTYFPKTARYGKPGFPDLLRQVSDIYHGEPQRIRHNTAALKSALAARSSDPATPPGLTDLAEAAKRAIGVFDPVHGGIQGAPKFPNAPILNMLWRAGDHDPAIREPVLITLRQMALGGIHDHLGGGFARYSVDGRWLTPHFEKMLYDNAQLLKLYALAAIATGEDIFREAAEGIVAWLEREMIVGDGGFASSLDADSEGVEGKYYVWDRSELESILGPDEAAFFSRIYDISVDGNFEGHNIPNRLDTPIPTPDEAQKLSALRTKLHNERVKRVPPGRDDKALADWNGMMIAALARAGTLLNRPAWIALAERAYRFVRESIAQENRLAHSWRNAVGVWPAFALDHATMAIAALSLAELNGSAELIVDARRDLDLLATNYADPSSGVLAMNARDGDELIVRIQPTHDDAVPNANGVYAAALIRCAIMTMDDELLARADRLFESLSRPMQGQTLAHASLWSALHLRLAAAQIIVAGPESAALSMAALAVPYPNRIVARLAPDQKVPDDHPAHAMMATARDQARAFVCVGERCSLPLTQPSEIAAAVAALR